MMNHINRFDSFLGYAVFPGLARGLEEESHFKWPIYGWMIKRIGMIPINRKSGIKASQSLRNAAELIKQRDNFSVAIMPEGTRTVTGKLGNFKKGGFLLAVESGLEILPMIQVGSEKINMKTSWLIKPGKVEVILEKPISTQDFTKETIDVLMGKTRNTFLEYVE